MSKKVTLTIDGNKVNVPEGTNLIDAAESAGIHIPNLCYLKGMRGIGACRLCLVDIEGGKAPVVGCITKAKEGMVVDTANEKLQEMRKFIIDLILSMHPMDCMTCTKAGVCNLQEYAYSFGIKESSLTRKKFGYPVDEANPFIKRDPDYCILCARCVRVCREQGTNVLDFMGRGVGAKVVTAMDKPLQESDCTFCGSCVDACPVNALLEADRWRKGREWDYEKSQSVCLSCGNGCSISVSSKDGAIVKVNSGADDSSVEKYICAIGRFGFDAISSDARVTEPMKRVNGQLQETSWDDALKIVADKLKGAKDNAGIISTASVLNQDAYLLSQFATAVIKTNNIDSTASLYADTDSMTLSDTVTIDDVDTIVLAGLDPSQWARVLPALDAGLRKRVSRGAKLITLNTGAIKISSAASVHLQGDEASSLGQIAKALIDKGNKGGKEIESAVSGMSLTEDIEKAAELITKASNPVIFCAPSLFHASRNLSLLLNIKIVAVPFESNARGVMALGLITKGKTYQEMTKGGVEVLYAVGEIPVKKRPNVKFLVVQSSYMTDLAKEADIILPAATSLESKGSIMNYLGKMKDAVQVIEPAGSSRQHKDIFIDLAKVMGKSIKDSTAKIKAAFNVSAKPKFSPFQKNEKLEANPAEIMASNNKNVITHSRLAWLEEAEAAKV